MKKIGKLDEVTHEFFRDKASITDFALRINEASLTEIDQFVKCSDSSLICKCLWMLAARVVVDNM